MEEQSGRGCFLSIVVPMYNEVDAIDGFFASIFKVLDVLGETFEIICVDDGSRDDTFERLREIWTRDSRVKVIRFSRNFGKEIALTAGLDHAMGRIVIPIDADLQDPPELILDMIAKWREGYDVVLPRRSHRRSDGLVKRFGAATFYRILGYLSAVEIPANVGDFRLMDRRVVDALALLPERARFMKGIFAWLGFRRAFIDFERKPRSAGDPKLKFLRLYDLAVTGLVSFSHVPLRIWSYLGFSCAFLALIYGAFIVIRTLIYGVELPGYASLITVILFMNGLTLFGLGVAGEYLSQVFLEVKRRPLYVVQETLGEFDAPMPGRLPRNVNFGNGGTEEAADRNKRQES